MIREATLDEVRKVTEYMKRFEDCTQWVKVDVDHTVKIYTDLISRGTGAMFMLFDDETGEMAGGLGCVVGPDLHYPRKLAVETYWYCENGQGRKLLDYFEKWAKEKGCDYTAMIHLSDSYPESLERFYGRRGYKLVEQHFVREV